MIKCEQFRRRRGGFWFGEPLILLAILIVCMCPAVAGSHTHRFTAVVLNHWPPQYQTSEYGQPSGFAIEVMDQVAAMADIDVTYITVDSWEEAYEALKSGRADIIPNLGIIPERKQWLSFTSPVETFPVVIHVRTSTSDIQGPDDLAGHTVATVRFNVGTHLIEQFRDIEHKVCSNVKEAMLELLAGHVDVLVYPQPVVIKLALEAGLQDRFKVTGPPLMEIMRGIAVHKDNADLLRQLEPAVQRFIQTQKYEQIYSNWYGRPVPYWTPKRIIVVMTCLVFLLLLVHTLRVTKVNRRMKASMADKRRAEAALIAGEEKYRLIVENQTDLTIKMDPRYRLLFASPSFCDAFGVSLMHLEGIQFISLVHRQDRDHVRLAMQGLQVMPHTCRHEGRSLTPKGWQWFSWSSKAILNSTGQIKVIISVGRNITERKHSDVRLQESEERFRAIFEQAADGVILLNPQNLAVAEFNDAAHQSLGYTRKAFDRIHLRRLIVPGPGQSVSDVVEKIVASRQHPAEIMLRNKSGQVHHFLLKQRPLRVRGENFLLGIWHDISERKMLEEQLVHSQKMEAIGTLAGGVSHDFNNILSIILGNVELALLDVSGDHPVTGHLQEVQSAGLRAKDVVRQLVSFSSKVAENRVPVPLASLIAESVQAQIASVPANIEIRKHFNATDMTVMADSAQIHQLVYHLCANAIQAMGNEGGVIDIWLSSAELDDAACEGNDLKPGPYAQLMFKDEGCGLAPEVIERIFDPYFSTWKADGGTGMGLAIAHGIVHSHNGTIVVERSRPGEGATFKVLLPLSSEEQSEPPEPPVDSQQAGVEGARILLVDDEQAIVTIGRHYLEKLGYPTQVFTNPMDALAEVRSDPSGFDLLITDLTMPEMDGRTLAEEILKLKSDLPIILCSGYHDNMEDAGAGAAGLTSFLTKPYKLKTLANAVRQALSEKVNP